MTTTIWCTFTGTWTSAHVPHLHAHSSESALLWTQYNVDGNMDATVEVNNDNKYDENNQKLYGSVVGELIGVPDGTLYVAVVGELIGVPGCILGASCGTLRSDGNKQSNGTLGGELEGAS